MLKAVRGLFIACLLLAIVLASVAGLLLWASLPVLEGERVLAGLERSVQIERDAQGVPTVRASGRLDLARATGFLHAQERFFQMDLQRRLAAGELSALVGPAALELDRRQRLHQLRRRAEQVISAASDIDQSVLFAYTHGVNQGLKAMYASPFEYYLLRAEPQAWKPEDCLLSLYAMFLDLNDENATRESSLLALRASLPPALLEFLLPPGTAWDAPLFGEAFEPPPVPGAEVANLRELPSQASAAPARIARLEVGSNSFAVDAAHGEFGAAVSGDMHLNFSVPNIWYRLRMIVDGAVQGLDIVGVSLPGVPAIVSGSNGQVAWAFTNSYGDWSDLVALEFDPERPQFYRAPDGWREIERRRETLTVKGGEAQTLDIENTVWGPIVERGGRRYALHWLAYEPEAVNLRLMLMEQARHVEEAMLVANSAGIPPQNILIADRDGRIAWTIAGRIPRRVGFDGSAPVSWLDGRGWDGWLAPEAYPRLLDPEAGRLWTANARVVGREGLSLLGDGGYAFGARARQIRDDLMAADRFSPEDLLGIALDDRAVFLGTWRERLQALLSERIAGDPLRLEAAAALAQWDGCACIDSVGYRLVRDWHDRVFEHVLDWLAAPARALDPAFSLDRFGQAEASVWALITEQPPQWLDAAYGSWDAFLLQMLDQSLKEIAGESGTLAGHGWGEVNRLSMQHPLSRALPLLGRLLDMPAQPLPGDIDLPRVQRPGAGASQRMVIVPGQEDRSLFHMPSGQSGNPLSPYYRAGHEAWADGEATPLLPQATKWRLTLRPAAG